MKLNPTEQIKKVVLERFDKAKTVIDPAENENGSWFLDVTLDDYCLVVEWHPKKGVGITSNASIAYGEGIDESFVDTTEAERRVLELLLSQTETKSPLTLKQIREEIGLTQTDLGKSLNKSQASIAKFEKGSNPRLSTLREVVSAMGGSLALLVKFPNGDEREFYPDYTETKKSARRFSRAHNRIHGKEKSKRNRSIAK